MRESTKPAPKAKTASAVPKGAKKKAWFQTGFRFNAVKHPIYAASWGLVFVYGWGFFSSFPWPFAVALSGVAVMVELLMPKLGELLRETFNGRMRAILSASVFACVVIGCFGGYVAIGAAQGPKARYEAAAKDLDAAKVILADLEADLRKLPNATPDMPASRQDAMRASNKEAADRLAPMIAAAKVSVEAAEEVVRDNPDPGPGLPHLEWYQKAAVSAAISFVIFAVPFASYKPPVRETVLVSPVETPAPKAKPSAPAPAIERNDGGWGTKENPGPRRLAAEAKARRRQQAAWN